MQHGGESRCVLREKESTGHHYHPRPVRCVSRTAGGVGRIDSEDNVAARAHCRKLDTFDGPSSPPEPFPPRLPAETPHAEIVVLRDSEEELRPRGVITGANEGDFRL